MTGLGRHGRDSASRRMGKCTECTRRFQVWFVGQYLCVHCAAARRRAERALVQPDLPLEGDGRGA